MVCVTCLIWAFCPIIGPLLGISRSQDEIIKWIHDKNMICLVNPIPIMQQATACYHDWALAEHRERCRIALSVFISWNIAFSCWTIRLINKKDNQRGHVTDPIRVVAKNSTIRLVYCFLRISSAPSTSFHNIETIEKGEKE